MNETPSSQLISTRTERIAQLARQMQGVALNTLAHHIDLPWLQEAFRRTRKDGATGVDGQTAREYEKQLTANLESLLERAKKGTYRAPPVKRVQIPKGDGTSRNLGLPTIEDKVLQRAVMMVLEPVYEQDFLPCSYGFRPGRSAHDALGALWRGLMGWQGGWVLEVDIEKYFDSIDKDKLREMLSQRVGDGVLQRLIGKWLNAGVLEEGTVWYPDKGTPQGGVISPLLANVYLHEVLDVWFEREVKPRLQEQGFLIRYADDFVMVFQAEKDARRVKEVLAKRFEKYGLKLHPEKTRLFEFRKPEDGKTEGEKKEPKRESFELLGFTHVWGKSQRGKWVVKKRTAKERLSRAIKRVDAWCAKNLHRRVQEQAKALSKKVLGHFGYYGVVGNLRRLQNFRSEVVKVWHGWLNRRSRATKLNWETMNLLLKQVKFPALPSAYALRSV
jgi:RNA-directed DNA polymerase